MLDDQKNLMNRFGGGPRQQAPLAPMQQQKPGVVEQFAQGKANEFANDTMNAGLGLAKEAGADMLSSAQGAFGNALGLGAEAGSGMEAAMFEAAPFEAIGAEGISATTGLGEALAGEAVAGGAAGAGATGLAAAMPWVGAGLLAGKAFGLFSKGGPVNSSELEAQAIALNNDEALEEARRMKQAEAQREAQYNAFNIDPDYKKCGGKMKAHYKAEGGKSTEDDYQDIARLYNLYMSKDTPKYEARPHYLNKPKVYSNDLPKFGEKYKMTPLNYKAEGGDVGFFDYLKKSFTEKPKWENYEAVQVPVLDGSGNPTNMTSTVYRPPTQANNLEKDIARDIYGEYDDGEDMGDASYLAGDPAPYSVQTYPLAPRGEIKMQSNTPPKGGPLLRKFGAPGIRRDPEEFNRDLNEYSIKRNNRLNPQPDDGSGIWEDMKGFFKSMGQSNGDDADVSGFNMGGRVGPLKSTQYKSAGGEVYTESYYNSSKK